MKIEFMELAYDLAFKGVGFVSPNPAVGAVFVKDGVPIGSGWHRRAGDDHAEVEAFNDALSAGFSIDDFAGTDLYVTLEPCSHFGKRPPCSKKIIELGVRRCFVGMKDPFAEVNGRGVKELEEAGIDVVMLDESTDLYKKIRLLNQQFLKSVNSNFPYVTLKMAMSLDGKICDNTGNSKWITDDVARLDGRIERARHDAILVGAKTIMADDSPLLLPDNFSAKSFKRVVLDRELSLSLELKIFNDPASVIIFTSSTDQGKVKILEEVGVQVVFSKDMDIVSILKDLKLFGVQSVFVEGGAVLAGAICDAFLDGADVLDQVIFYYGNFLVGGDAKSAIAGKGLLNLVDRKKLQYVDSEKLGDALKVRGFFKLF